MIVDDRLTEIDEVLQATTAWSRVAAEIQKRIDLLTERLIAKDDEGARGAIKELRQLIDLPEALRSERDHLAAALSDSSDAA
jgi:hypothetical protein